MGKNDIRMANIDLNVSGLTLEVEIGRRQLCDANWGWDHMPDQRAQRGPSILLWLVTGGQATLMSSFGDYAVRRGDFFLMPGQGYEYHGRHDPATPLDVAWLFFRGVDRQGHPLTAQTIEGLPFHTALADVVFADRLMDRLLSATGPLQGEWLRVLLDEVRRQRTGSGASVTERQIRELGRQIQANPGHYCGLADMQRECRYSRDHLIRLFRVCHGATPIEFLIRARMDAARGLLAVSSLSVKQIAAQLGYADAFGFSRQFRLRVGVSPSDYRGTCKRNPAHRIFREQSSNRSPERRNQPYLPP
jgi:AraC-like DNA-binding protein